jgi:autotransporter-associated beta strand protein
MLSTGANFLGITNSLGLVSNSGTISLAGNNFAVGGTNVMSNIDTLKLAGGTTTLGYQNGTGPAAPNMPTTNLVVTGPSLFSPGNGYASIFGNLTLGANLTFSGGSAAGTTVTLNNITATGTAQILNDPATSDATCLVPTGTISAPSGGTLTIAVPVVDANPLAGQYTSLTIGGSGRVVLTGSNSFSGGVVINSGATLQAGNGGLTGLIPDVGVAISIAKNGVLAYALGGTGTEISNNTIGGAGGLVQMGPGNLILDNGIAAYTGGTTVKGGTLSFSNDAYGLSASGGIVTDPGAGNAAGLTWLIHTNVSRLDPTSGNRSLTLNSGTTVLTFQGETLGYPVTFLGTIAGTGGLEIASGGTLQVGSYNGTGNNAGSLGSVSAVKLDAGSLLVFDRTDNYGGPVVAAISGPGAVQQAEGTLTLTGSSSFTGGIEVGSLLSGGTLQLAGGILGNGPVQLDSGGTALVLDATGTAMVPGNISGTGKVVQNGAGTTILAGSNTYTGGTTIIAGTLQLGDGLSLCGYVGRNITDNSLLSFANPLAQTFAGSISGSGSLTKSGTGTLTLAGSNTYSGGTSITAGVLALANSAALQQSTLCLGGGGGMSFGGLTSAVLGGLAGGGSLSLVNTAGSPVALAVGSNGAATTFNGSLSGSGSLLKVGGGKLTLTGSNIYTGGTTVSAGAIVAGGPGTLSPYSDMTVNGGTLDASGYATTVKSLTMTGAGTLDLGIGNLLTSSNTATLGGTLKLSGVPSGSFVELMAYGWETGTFATVTGLPGGHTLQYNATELDLVPEPSTLALLGAGAIGMLAFVALRARRAALGPGHVAG